LLAVSKEHFEVILDIRTLGCFLTFWCSIIGNTYKPSKKFSSDTPLLYKAVPSWFVRVKPIIDKLLNNNKESYW